MSSRGIAMNPYDVFDRASILSQKTVTESEIRVKGMKMVLAWLKKSLVKVNDDSVYSMARKMEEIISSGKWDHVIPACSDEDDLFLFFHAAQNHNWPSAVWTKLKSSSTQEFLPTYSEKS